MAMLTDTDLLLRYAEDGSEAAFSEIVSRHVNLVYSTALRLVGGDEHLAYDVAQSVFTDLAIFVLSRYVAPAPSRQSSCDLSPGASEKCVSCPQKQKRNQHVSPKDGPTLRCAERVTNASIGTADGIAPVRQVKQPDAGNTEQDGEER